MANLQVLETQGTKGRAIRTPKLTLSHFVFEDLSLYFNDVYACMSVEEGCTHECACLQEPEEDLRSPRAGFTGKSHQTCMLGTEPLSSKGVE